MSSFLLMLSAKEEAWEVELPDVAVEEIEVDLVEVAIDEADEKLASLKLMVLRRSTWF